jgi:hypothetical protein
MSKLLASAALSLLLGGFCLPAFAEVAAPEAEPRSYLSPTDETEPTPRVPPVTQPKPMERTRMGVPAEAAPPERAAPSPKPEARPVRLAPPPGRMAQPRRTTAPRTVTPQRRIARTPVPTDTSLEAIFKQRRFDATAPLDSLAPRSGPAASDPGRRPAMTYNYAPAPPAFDGAPCPTRSPASLGALFACAR